MRYSIAYALVSRERSKAKSARLESVRLWYNEPDIFSLLFFDQGVKEVAGRLSAPQGVCVCVWVCVCSVNSRVCREQVRRVPKQRQKIAHSFQNNLRWKKMCTSFALWICLVATTILTFFFINKAYNYLVCSKYLIQKWKRKKMKRQQSVAETLKTVFQKPSKGTWPKTPDCFSGSWVNFLLTPCQESVS